MSQPESLFYFTIQQHLPQEVLSLREELSRKAPFESYSI